MLCVDNQMKDSMGCVLTGWQIANISLLSLHQGYEFWKTSNTAS